MIRAVLPALALLAACGASQPGEAATSSQPSQSPNANWQLDGGASSVRFEANNAGSTVSGRFETFSATIVLDPDDLSDASIEATVSTPSLDGIDDSSIRDALRGSAGLAVSSHPDARFVSSSITRTEAGYEAVGELTIKGNTARITLPFTLDISEGRAVAEGEFVIDRTTFDVGSGWDTVREPVTIRLHIEADAAN